MVRSLWGPQTSVVLAPAPSLGPPEPPSLAHQVCPFTAPRSSSCPPWWCWCRSCSPESSSHSKDSTGPAQDLQEGLGNYLFLLELQARVLKGLPHLHIRCALSQLQDPLLVRHDDADAGLVARSLPATAKTQQGLRFRGALEITCLESSSKPMISDFV